MVNSLINKKRSISLYITCSYEQLMSNPLHISCLSCDELILNHMPYNEFISNPIWYVQFVPTHTIHTLHKCASWKLWLWNVYASYVEYSTRNLTQWSRVMHICVSKLAIIARILSIGPAWTNFSEILIAFIYFHSRECIWKYRLENGHFVSASTC